MRRLRWIALAALLLAAGTLVLTLGEEKGAAPRADVRFPLGMRGPEYERFERRATLVLPAPAAPATGSATADARPPARRDPFLVSLPVKPDAPVVVFEANALRHSRLGERFVACVRARHGQELEAFQEKLGLDPFKDVDRVAYVGDAVVVSGFFDRVRWDVLGREPEGYGEAGRLWRDGGLTVGAWRDQIVVFSERPEDVRAAIDQLEGRAAVPASGIPEDMAYGEVYGVLPGAAARRLIGPDDRGLAERIAALASRVELHVDAMQDVAAVVRVRGEDQAGLSDLARSLGAALAVARVRAQASQDRRLSDLLESAAVQPGEKDFSLQLALPADRLEAWFEGCDARSPTPVP